MLEASRRVTRSEVPRREPGTAAYAHILPELWAAGTYHTVKVLTPVLTERAL